MLWNLRALFILILAVMVALATWASLLCPLFAIPPEVLRHPWFLTTLADAYFAFLTFFVWVAWKEQGLAARALWLVAILLLGNMAMAAYFLRELFSVGSAGQLSLVFTRRNPGNLTLAGSLAGTGVIIYLLAWLA
jgi:hypothetical protein